MNVLVTGGQGRIGKYVVRDLVEAGHRVMSVDLVYSPGWNRGFRTRAVDLTDVGQVYQALIDSAAEAVIHLGAHPSNARVPALRTFGDNTQCMFNVFQACADLGIKRVVSASSIRVYGLHANPPLYFPIDEAHPVRPNGPYEIAKVLGEQMADYFVDRHGLEIASFRFASVLSPVQLESLAETGFRDPYRPHRIPWCPIDVRDAAAYCRRAIEVGTIESGPYNIASSHYPLENLVELVQNRWGDQVEIREGLGTESPLLSTQQAQRVFAFQPRYCWTVDCRFPEPELETES